MRLGKMRGTHLMGARLGIQQVQIGGQRILDPERVALSRVQSPFPRDRRCRR
jgi:hypothetical protein